MDYLPSNLEGLVGLLTMRTYKETKGDEEAKGQPALKSRRLEDLLTMRT